MTEEEKVLEMIKRYEGWSKDPDSTRFEKLLFENAANKLKAGVDRIKVENWVVKVEKLWRKML